MTRPTSEPSGPHLSDMVEFHAVKGGREVFIQMTRMGALIEMGSYEYDGWTVHIEDAHRDGPTDGPGAWSRWAAFRSTYASLSSRTLRMQDRTSRIAVASATLHRSARRIRLEGMLTRTAKGPIAAVDG